SPETLAARALQALNRKEAKTVYISRDAGESEKFIRQVNAYGYTVHAISPLRYETIEVGYMPFTDWIFFSSRRGVIHFFEQDLIAPATAKIAAIGSGTAAALREFGINPDFTGFDGDTKETAKAFAAIAKGRDVLFPGTDGGLRTIQQELE